MATEDLSRLYKSLKSLHCAMAPNYHIKCEEGLEGPRRPWWVLGSLGGNMKTVILCQTLPPENSRHETNEKLAYEEGLKGPWNPWRVLESLGGNIDKVILCLTFPSEISRNQTNENLPYEKGLKVPADDMPKCRQCTNAACNAVSMTMP